MGLVTGMVTGKITEGASSVMGTQEGQQGELQGRRVKFFPHWSSYIMATAIVGGVAVIAAGVFLEAYTAYGIIGGALTATGAIGFFAIKSFAPVREWELIAKGYERQITELKSAGTRLEGAGEQLAEQTRKLEELEKEKEANRIAHEKAMKKERKERERIAKQLQQVTEENGKMIEKMKGVEKKHEEVVEKFTVEINRLQKYIVELTKLLNQIDTQGTRWNESINFLEQNCKKYEEANKEMKGNLDGLHEFTERAERLAEYYKGLGADDGRLGGLIQNFSKFSGTTSEVRDELSRQIAELRDLVKHLDEMQAKGEKSNEDTKKRVERAKSGLENWDVDFGDDPQETK